MPISSLAQTQQVIQNLLALQTQGNTLEQQISTGLKSQSYAGIAPQAAQVVNLNATQSQQQGYHRHDQHGEHAAPDHEPRDLDHREPGAAVRHRSCKPTPTTPPAPPSRARRKRCSPRSATISTPTDGEGYIFSGSAYRDGALRPGRAAQSRRPRHLRERRAAGRLLRRATTTSPRPRSTPTSPSNTASPPTIPPSSRSSACSISSPTRRPSSSNNPADVANVNQAADHAEQRRRPSSSSSPPRSACSSRSSTTRCRSHQQSLTPRQVKHRQHRECRSGDRHHPARHAADADGGVLPDRQHPAEPDAWRTISNRRRTGLQRPR